MMTSMGFPGGAVVKNLPADAGDADAGSFPGLGRSPGGGHGNPVQCSRLENPMDRGAWWGVVHGVAKSRTRLSTHVQLLEQMNVFLFINYISNEGQCISSAFLSNWY